MDIAAAGFGLAQASTVLLIFCTPLLSWFPPLVAVCLVLVLPFSFAGWFLASAFTRWPLQAGRLYAADLFGAALGCPASIALLNCLGPVNTILAAGVCGAAAGLMVERTMNSRAAKTGNAVALALCVAAVAWSVAWPFARLENIQMTWDANTKQMLQQLHGPGPWKIVASNWDAFSRTDVVAGPDPDFLEVYNDGDTPTFMLRAGGAISQPEALRSMIGFVPFHVWPPQARERMLCIGAGGGLDVQLAHLAGMKEVTAVDINSSLPLLLEQFRAYHGDVYGQAGTTLLVDEGRHFLRRQERPFDEIYMALTQTGTAGGQSVALVESYIHTVEAFEDALRHLASNGRLVLVFEQELLLQRAFLTAAEAVGRVTGEPPGQALSHLAALSEPSPEEMPYTHLLVVKRSPLTEMELGTLRRVAQERKFRVQFLPDQPPTPAFQELLEPVRLRSSRVAVGETNISPVHDDSPFFLDLTFGVPTVLRSLLLVAALFTAGLVGMALTVANRAVGSQTSWRSLPILVALLGIGFMLVQNVVVQRFALFLGYPTLSLSVVLFSMLVGGSLGSLVAHRQAERGQWGRLAALSALVIPSVLLLNYAAPLATEHQLVYPLPGRIALAAVWIMPPGFFMGLFFPTALRLAERARRPNAIPLLWAINGVASVLGGALTVPLAKLFNFTYALSAAAACYAIAALLLLHLVRRNAAGQLAARQQSNTNDG